MASYVGHYEPRGTHWIATHAIDRIVALCGIIPFALVALILRIVVAWGIFLAGQAKIVGPTLPFSFRGSSYSVILPAQVRDEMLGAFATLFPNGPVSSALIAHIFVYGEFVLPLCLFIGFGTRIAAALLLIATSLLQLYFVPGELPMVHLYWGAILLVLMTCGPGPISLDCLIRAQYRK
jgi:putative oxidoreductase